MSTVTARVAPFERQPTATPRRGEALWAVIKRKPLGLASAALLVLLVTTAMLAIAIVIIPGNSRIVRGAVLSAKQNRYVEAAQAIGCRHPRIITTHILPNVTAPILIIASIWFGNAILIEATLSFLGLGTQPPTPSWGLMLSSTGRAFMEQAPWLAIFPGLAISLAVLCFNLFGDTLRDAWDPRLRRQGWARTRARKFRRGPSRPPTTQILPTQAFMSWSRIGRRRMRLPVAAKIALHNAGAIGGTPGSPTPPSGALKSPGIRWTRISPGACAIRATSYAL